MKISTVKHELVYSAEGLEKTVIGTDSDTHDSKESTRFRKPTQKWKPCSQLHLESEKMDDGRWTSVFSSPECILKLPRDIITYFSKACAVFFRFVCFPPRIIHLS